MNNADRSQTARIKLLNSRNLAFFRRQNPNFQEGGAGYRSFDAGSLIERRIAERAGGFSNDNSPPCVPPSDVVNFGIFASFTPDLPFNQGAIFSWDPVPNATSYSFTSDYNSSDILFDHTPGTTTVRVSSYDYNYTITITARNACGSSTSSAQPCFLAGSLVQMADGSTKPIEDVKVGEKLLGAFGETNTVLALHRPLLGEALMCKINDEHSTTNHHPHISADRKFYCGDPTTVNTRTYGRPHKVIDEQGQVVDRMLHGLRPSRVLKLDLGVELKTVEGSRPVQKLETYSLPPETQLYNLVMSGSHTYHVDGYAVTGWPSEEDFDYDMWKAV